MNPKDYMNLHYQTNPKHQLIKENWTYPKHKLTENETGFMRLC